MHRPLNEFNIHYSVDILAKKLDDLEKLRRKLNPASLPADRHMSIEEGYAALQLLGDVISQIKMLEEECATHTGSNEINRIYDRIFPFRK